MKKPNVTARRVRRAVGNRLTRKQSNGAWKRQRVKARRALEAAS